MTTKIDKVPIEAIDPNPFRRTRDYPYVERKIEALQRSIKDVGLWEGVIARERGNRYEIAFGHHRIEAARRNHLHAVPLIVRRELSDEQMLAFMGRENMEDYNADFLVMLETWEAGAEWASSTDEQKSQPIDIAVLLGWTTLQSGKTVILGATARACSSAHSLIKAGHLSRDDLRDLSVYQVREIVERAFSRVDQLERVATKTKRPVRELTEAKTIVGKAAKETARRARAGQVATKDLRSSVDIEAFKGSRSAPPKPLFEMFGKALSDGIAKMLHDDTTAEKLGEVVKALDQITYDDDKRVVARLDFELGELSERTTTWRKHLTPSSTKLATIHGGKQ